MNEFYFIKDFSWKGELKAKGREGGHQPLFVRQGDLDGACAVYSLMMMLMLHRKVNRSELEDRRAAISATDGGYNSYMRLQDQFLSGLIGLYKDGYCFEQLAEELHSCFKDKATASVRDAFGKRDNSRAKQELVKEIVETIKAGHPVERGYSRRKCIGHAVVAIGYTTYLNKVRLFCLDPGFEIPKTAFWNTIIDLSYFESANAIYCDTCYPLVGESFEVTVDEILTIDV